MWQQPTGSGRNIERGENFGPVNHGDADRPSFSVISSPKAGEMVKTALQQTNQWKYGVMWKDKQVPEKSSTMYHVDVYYLNQLYILSLKPL